MVSVREIAHHVSTEPWLQLSIYHKDGIVRNAEHTVSLLYEII